MVSTNNTNYDIPNSDDYNYLHLDPEQILIKKDLMEKYKEEKEAVTKTSDLAKYQRNLVSYATMGLSAEEIAEDIGTTTSSIRKARQRTKES